MLLRLRLESKRQRFIRSIYIYIYIKESYCFKKDVINGFSVLQIILNPFFNKWQQHWNTPEYKKKREQAAKNRRT